MTLPILMMIMLQVFPVLNSENLAPAMYVFGDSMLDNGNNNLLPTLAKANFPPYGISFDGGATGRFTNGKTVADFIAEFLELPYPPAYLSLRRLLNPRLRHQKRGLNFASGSCGILPETGNILGKCLNLGEQVGIFERVVKHELASQYGSSDELSNHLAKSVFVVSIGSNDYINNYMETQHYDTSTRYSPLSYAKLLNQRLSQQFQRLYDLGARKVAMFEIGPIGCIPSITSQFEHDGKCVEEINQLAVLFNDNLAQMLMNLTSALEGSSFVLGHAHWLGYDAAINPSKYGLKDSTTACCVTWFNGTSACIPGLGAMACRDLDYHYFWDGYHLTETVYRTIATHCINGSSVCIPKNIKQLVSQD